MEKKKRTRVSRSRKGKVLPSSKKVVETKNNRNLERDPNSKQIRGKGGAVKKNWASGRLKRGTGGQKKKKLGD